MRKVRYLLLSKFILIFFANLLIGCSVGKNRLVDNQIFKYKEDRNKDPNSMEGKKIGIRSLFNDLNNECLNSTKYLYEINDLKEKKDWLEVTKEMKKTGFKLLEKELNDYKKLINNEKEIDRAKETLKKVDSFYTWIE
ncbi:MAG: hypothetical protein E7Y34_00315 [Mycoplasma sp.]|nr:hypothetical protein [Mycoplasma sp.]